MAAEVLRCEHVSTNIVHLPRNHEAKRRGRRNGGTLTDTPCAELEVPGRWASVGNFKKAPPGSSVTCPVGATCHQRASVSAACSFCFVLPRQGRDICRHVFAAQNFGRHHSASSASSTFHAGRRAVARNVPAALACGFLVDRWALLRLGAGNSRNLT